VIAATFALYASPIFAAVEAALIVYGLARRRRPALAHVLAFVIALLPMIFFSLER
jgi:4-amino-4-deoxy-L-arabinose transferase-like glycosyltransferase